MTVLNGYFVLCLNIALTDAIIDNICLDKLDIKECLYDFILISWVHGPVWSMSTELLDYKLITGTPPNPVNVIR